MRDFRIGKDIIKYVGDKVTSRDTNLNSITVELHLLCLICLRAISFNDYVFELK